MDIKGLTETLCSLMSVSGHETYSREALRAIAGTGFDEMRGDAVGNFIFVKRCKKPGAPSVLIDTHFDEIGFFVTGIKEGGFLGITPVGGLDSAILQASRVAVYGKDRKVIHGVITSTPPHLKKKNEGKKLKNADELLIDTGYSVKELEKYVSVGSPAGFEPVYTELISGRLAGRSFDNKACCAAALNAVMSADAGELAADVYLQFSCYEETLPTGGAAAGTFGISPDYAVVIDVNFAAEPGAPEFETVNMGEGISVTLSSSTDRRLTRMAMQLCADEDIKYQRVASPSSTGTNAVCVNLTGRGVPVVDVGIPIKGMHTYNEILSLDDVCSLSRFVGAFICSDRIASAFGGYSE